MVKKVQISTKSISGGNYMNLKDVILDLKELKKKRQIFSSQTPAEGIPVKVQDDSTKLVHFVWGCIHNKGENVLE